VRIKIEPRLTSTWKLSVAIPFFSLAAALFSGGVEPVAKPVIYKKLSTEKTWFFRLVP